MARQAVAIAEAAMRARPPAVAPITEVGHFDGVVYGVGESAEGVDVAALLLAERSRGRAPPIELAVAAALSLVETARALPSGRGRGGLGALFPAGLCVDALFLDPVAHRLGVRSLVGACGLATAPTTFRAPEGDASPKADVYAVGRLLLALLTTDPSGLAQAKAPSSLARLLPFLVQERAEHRPPLDELQTSLEGVMNELRTTPQEAIAAAVTGPYKSLHASQMAGFDAPPRVVDDIRSRLPWIDGALTRFFPAHASPAPGARGALAAGAGSSSHGGGSPQRGLPGGEAGTHGLVPEVSEEGGAVFTDGRPATRGGKSGRTSPTMRIGDIVALMQPAPNDDARNNGVPNLAPAPRPTQPTVIIDAARFVPFQAPPVGSADAVVSFQVPPSASARPLLSAGTSTSESSASATKAPPADSVTHARESASGTDGDDQSAMAPLADTANHRYDEKRGSPPPTPAFPKAPRTQHPRGKAAVPLGEAPPAPQPSTGGGLDVAVRPARKPSVQAHGSARAAPRPQERKDRGAPRRHGQEDGDDGFDGVTEIAAGVEPPVVPALVRAGTRTRAPAAANVDASAAPQGIKTGHEGAVRRGPRDRAAAAPGDGRTESLPAEALDAVRDGRGPLAAPLGASTTGRHGGGGVPAPRPAERDEPARKSGSPQRAASVLGLPGVGLPTGPVVPTRPEAPRPVGSSAKSSGTWDESEVPSLVSKVHEPILSRLVIDAPAEARVVVDGIEVGVGRVVVSLPSSARAIVKVLHAAFAPWSSTVAMNGRARLRIRPHLRPPR